MTGLADVVTLLVQWCLYRQQRFFCINNLSSFNWSRGVQTTTATSNILGCEGNVGGDACWWCWRIESRSLARPGRGGRGGSGGVIVGVIVVELSQRSSDSLISRETFTHEHCVGRHHPGLMVTLSLAPGSKMRSHERIRGDAWKHVHCLEVSTREIKIDDMQKKKKIAIKKR